MIIQWRFQIVREELWMEDCNIVQEEVPKTMSKEKECKRAKWLSEQALQKSGKRRKRQGRKGKIHHPTECRVPENSKER